MCKKCGTDNCGGCSGIVLKQVPGPQGSSGTAQSIISSSFYDDEFYFNSPSEQIFVNSPVLIDGQSFTSDNEDTITYSALVRIITETGVDPSNCIIRVRLNTTAVIAGSIIVGSAKIFKNNRLLKIDGEIVRKTISSIGYISESQYYDNIPDQYGITPTTLINFSDTVSTPSNLNLNYYLFITCESDINGMQLIHFSVKNEQKVT